MPGAILNDLVIVDAVVLRLLKRSVGDLVHADRARCWSVEREGIPRPLPPPVRSRHRIAGSLDLGESGQQIGRDDGSRMLAEQRPVLPPRFGRALVERIVQGKEHLGRLIDRVVRPVDGRPKQ